MNRLDSLKYLVTSVYWLIMFGLYCNYVVDGDMKRLFLYSIALKWKLLNSNYCQFKYDTISVLNCTAHWLLNFWVTFPFFLLSDHKGWVFELLFWSKRFHRFWCLLWPNDEERLQANLSLLCCRLVTMYLSEFLTIFITNLFFLDNLLGS